ncbi:MAG: hypothetical protein HDR11_07640 [Lachnospiraceae bacterium]|nr:hypothetical protein [Lachnospiraceae bacterium]
MREDKIISALIGLVGACNNNPKTADTDSLVIKALAFPLLCPEYGDREMQEIVNDIYLEKNAIAPGCASCTAPCGNTSDYDMRRIYEADDGIRNAKLRVLAKIRELAAYVCQCQKNGTIRYMDSGFFYKALSYVSYDMDEAALLGLLDEVENIECDIKAGVIQNDSEDYKN